MMGLEVYVPVFEGKVASFSFLFSIVSLLVMANANLQYWIIGVVELVYIILLALFVFIPIVKVIICSHAIGLVFSVGALMALSGETYAYFGFYMMGLAFFHLSEYVMTAIFNAHTLSMDSFLINHSREYSIAAVTSWIEYWVEFYFFPNSLKSLHLISCVGIILVVGGESLRKAAMMTAGSNFTHLVQYRKHEDHVLVTHGVYSLFRHPSYVGWFYWSVGTQLVLCNPVCLLGYTVASWMFFYGRILDEEEFLIQFFGEDYVQYMHTVRTGIPLIKGYPFSKVEALLRLRQHTVK